MTRDAQLIQVDSGDKRIMSPLMGRTDSPERFDPYRTAQRALRGRYGLAIVLGAIVAAAGAAVGWRMDKPLYESAGLVQIKYSLPPVMKQESNSYTPTEIYQAFLQSQQALLTSRRLVDMALQDPAWKSLGIDASPQAIQDFADGLTVQHKNNQDHLRISFVDRDPEVAGAAVKSLINSYAKVYRGQDEQFQKQRLQALEDRRKELQTQLENLQTQIRTISEGIGFANVDPLYEASVQKVLKIQSLLTDIRLARVLQSPETLSEQQIAMIDQTMQAYLAERDRWESNLQQLKLQGYGENHRQVLQSRKSLEVINERIAAYTQDYRGLPVSARGSAVSQDRAVAFAGQSREVLQTYEQGIGQLDESARQQMKELAAKRLQIENLEPQEEKVREELEEVTHRMQSLQIESGGGGRLEIISAGETPIAPSRDRRMHMAAIGALGGGLLPAAVLVFLGFVSNRYRYSDETAADLSSHIPLLGILPMLPDGLSDMETATHASRSVHQIRVMLQVGKTADKHPAYQVTSASSGEGKTSLTVALGLSYAACGSQTLIIDCDLVGQHLTYGFNAEDRVGLFETLTTGMLREHVMETPHKGLWILPVGRADALDAGIISAGAVAKLVAEARKYFDVVLIDTGPALGSVEAAAVAPEVDGVIFVVSRHQQRPTVERAVRHLSSIGAKQAGMVFNRAEPKDFNRSVYSSGTRSGTVRNRLARISVMENRGFSRFGPLVQSVASCQPLSTAGDKQ